MSRAETARPTDDSLRRFGYHLLRTVHAAEREREGKREREPRSGRGLETSREAKAGRETTADREAKAGRETKAGREAKPGRRAGREAKASGEPKAGTKPGREPSARQRAGDDIRGPVARQAAATEPRGARSKRAPAFSGAVPGPLFYRDPLLPCPSERDRIVPLMVAALRGHVDAHVQGPEAAPPHYTRLALHLVALAFPLSGWKAGVLDLLQAQRERRDAGEPTAWGKGKPPFDRLIEHLLVLTDLIGRDVHDPVRKRRLAADAANCIVEALDQLGPAWTAQDGGEAAPDRPAEDHAAGDPLPPAAA